MGGARARGWSEGPWVVERASRILPLIESGSSFICSRLGLRLALRLASSGQEEVGVRARVRVGVRVRLKPLVRV